MRHRRCRACNVNVLALCGSLRAASMNAALLRATARLAPDGTRVEIFSGLAELPLFNPDLEADMPAPARRLQAAISACDALLIASPEYAHGVTAVIKNALDWLVSFPPFVDKPVDGVQISLGCLGKSGAYRSRQLVEGAERARHDHEPPAVSEAGRELAKHDGRRCVVGVGDDVDRVRRIVVGTHPCRGVREHDVDLTDVSGETSDGARITHIEHAWLDDGSVGDL